MAITLSFSDQDHCGPGYAFTWIISAGPIPVDDYVVVTAKPAAEPNFSDAGIAITRGFLVGSVVFGVAQTSVIANGTSVLVAAGTSMDMTITQYHSNGTMVATTSYPGALPWDPTTRLYRLLENSGATGGVLSQILAAVQRTFPTT